MNGIERRSYDVTELRVASAAEGQPRHFIGHAAVFNTLSLPIPELGGVGEEIKRGAFRGSLQSDDVRALFNHDPNFVLGRVGAGTLTVREDRNGLAVDITPPDTQWARDLATSIDRGDIFGMSFGFRTLDEEFLMRKGQPVRILKAVELRDVSPVTFPAYDDTDIAVRSLNEWLKVQGGKFVGHRDDREALLQSARRRLQLVEL